MTEETQQRSPIEQASTWLQTSFGLPPLQNALKSPGSSPYPLWGSSLACILQLPMAARRVQGYPPVLALVPLSLVYGGIGGILMQDLEAGSSTATAWGLIYLSLFGKKAWRSKRPGPIFAAGYIGLSTLGYLHEVWVD